VIVGGVERKRNKAGGMASVALAPGVVRGSLTEKNIRDQDIVRPFVQEALDKSGFKGLEIGVVIPDESARISFLVAEKLSNDTAEQHTFIRWKLKKTVPFDIDSAQIAFQVLGPHSVNGSKSTGGFDLLVALSPRPAVQEYEDLMESLDLHAGFVVPSSLAALNLLRTPAEDALFLKLSPDCITTTVFQNRKVQFFRRVSEGPLFDAVHPTVLYYQDKLGGKNMDRMFVCGYDEDARMPVGDLEERLGVHAERLEPRSIDDIFKPVLGAVHFSWANLT
jgi:type IV pilus assembly protein PilM